MTKIQGVFFTLLATVSLVGGATFGAMIFTAYS